MMAQTFVRTSELICARWDEFDLEANRWTIPAERDEDEDAAHRRAFPADDGGS